MSDDVDLAPAAAVDFSESDSAVWRLIAEWPGYEVDAYGTVRSRPRISVVTYRRGVTVRRPVAGKVLAWVYPRRPAGFEPYPAVNLCCNGVRAKIYVHQLVAGAWLGPRPSPRHLVRHLDDDPRNPAAYNLAWGLTADNTADCRRNGTWRPPGSRYFPDGAGGGRGYPVVSAA